MFELVNDTEEVQGQLSADPFLTQMRNKHRQVAEANDMWKKPVSISAKALKTYDKPL